MNQPILVPTSSKAFADLERHLLDTVRPRFLKARRLGAFDFFCIVIWKANRAKSKVARRLLERGVGDLEATVSKLTRELASAKSDEQRLRCLIEDWKLRLPMASAILAVLYPETFTVYDVRVTDVLGRFKYLADVKPFPNLWAGYTEFRRAVAEATPSASTWRERDHMLWGESFARQLREDIRTAFPRDDA